MRVRALSAAGPGEAVSARGYAPLFILAGSHGSLHWAVATFYFMLPFIKETFQLTYAQTGLFATIVHASSFFANIPSGMLVDVTGRRRACQIVSLALAGVGMVGIGFMGWPGLLPALLAELAGPELTGTAIGFGTTFMRIGVFAAPPLFGLVVDRTDSYDLGWWMLAGIAVVGPATLVFMRPQARRQ